LLLFCFNSCSYWQFLKERISWHECKHNLIFNLPSQALGFLNPLFWPLWQMD
jgi:hypothetical protein